MLAVSGSAIFIRLSTAPALVLMVYRLLLAEVVLLPAAVLGARTHRPRASGRELGLACLAGVFLALHFVSWITSLEYTTVASSVALVSIQPVFVLAGSWFFLGQRTSGRALAGALLAVAGAGVIGAGDFALGGMAWYGDILALTGAVMIAGYLIIGAGLRRRWSLWLYTSLVYGVAALVGVTTCLLRRVPLAPYPAREWLLFVALAVFPTLMGHTVFNWALGRVPPAVVSVSILGEPVGAALLAWMILGEMPPPATLAGGLVVLAGTGWFLQNQVRDADQGPVGIRQLPANKVQ